MSKNSVERFDELFLAIAQNVSNIETLLETFLCFLQRKTDFFHIMTKPNESIGFPQGKAFEMVKSSFDRNQLIYLTRAQPHLLSTLKKSVKGSTGLTHPSAISEPTTVKATAAKCDRQRPPVPVLPQSEASCPNQHDTNSHVVAEDSSESNNKSKSHCHRHQSDDSNEHRDPEHAVTKSNEYNRISVWNGGKTDLYWWNQSLTEATMEIVFKPPIIKEELKIEMKSTRIKIEYKGNVLIDGEFYEQIQLQESIWGIEDQSRLVITLEKGRENWWGNIMKGQKEIDLTKVESIKKIQDFDDETQAAIRKIMWDRDRESKGLKTSEELQNEELLKKAWNAEGSPFKGQPFDSSKLKLGNVPIRQENRDD